MRCWICRRKSKNLVKDWCPLAHQNQKLPQNQLLRRRQEVRKEKNRSKFSSSGSWNKSIPNLLFLPAPWELSTRLWLTYLKGLHLKRRSSQNLIAELQWAAGTSRPRFDWFFPGSCPSTRCPRERKLSPSSPAGSRNRGTCVTIDVNRIARHDYIS